MTKSHALTIATRALEREARRLAFEANLYSKGLKTGETQRAYRERKKVVEAIEVLKAMN